MYNNLVHYCTLIYFCMYFQNEAFDPPRSDKYLSDNFSAVSRLS
jgi:hypothetical protein